MRETLSIFLRDVRRSRWTLLVFLLLLAGEVATYCSPQRREASAEPWRDVFLMLWVLMTWVVQFVLVTQLIHGDAPARIGAQWRSRPFRPGQLTMAKVCGIGACALAPPWVAGQVARLLLGLRPGMGEAEGPLYHLAALSAFTLIAVVASSTGRAFLTAIGLLVAFGFAFALVASMLQGQWSWWQGLWHTLSLWLATDVLVSFALCGLALGSLASAYRKGTRPRVFLAIAWACCLLFALSGGPTPRLDPTYPEASERFRFVAAWTTRASGNELDWYGRLHHVRTKPRRLVVPEGIGLLRGRWVEWPIPLRAVEPARIDGLGDVGFAPVSEFQEFLMPTIGPLDPTRFATGRAGEFGNLSYTVRTYELLTRFDPGVNSRQSDWSWTLRGAEGRRVEARTFDPRVRIVSFDPAARQVSWPEGGDLVFTLVWPIGAGLRGFSIVVPHGSEALLLRETIVGKGLVGYEDIPLDAPPDWRSQQEKTTDLSRSR